jgi:L-ascorbate metabolism protein UlaG (beta-lactamase superfamily)
MLFKAEFIRKRCSILNITWYTTASIRLDYNGESLMFDPYVPKGRAELLEAYKNETRILITHGHLDHLASVPVISSKTRAITYCTKTPKETLLSQGVDTKLIREIKAGDILKIGKFSVKVLAGKHIEFDLKLVASTLIRSLRRFGDALELRKLNQVYLEKGETVAFQVTIEGKVILVLGSLSLNPETDYGTPDVLVLPYQGRSDIEKTAVRIIAKLTPKLVVLDHFDDAFPPISKTVGTSGLAAKLARELPQIQLLKPESGKSFAV